jgi:6-phosphofructokinase 1
MGRDAGLIALRSGIAGGAEAILIPETKMNVEELVGLLKKDRMLNYSSMIVVVAEGDEEGGAFSVSEKVKKQLPDIDTRVTVLGHIQRGGKPSCMDRILATRMGLAAVEGLINGQKNIMVGIINNQVKFLLLENSTKQSSNQNQELLNVLEILTLSKFYCPN